MRVYVGIWARASWAEGAKDLGRGRQSAFQDGGEARATGAEDAESGVGECLRTERKGVESLEDLLQMMMGSPWSEGI